MSPFGLREREQGVTHSHLLESIPGPYWRPAFAEKQMAIVGPPPSPSPQRPLH